MANTNKFRGSEVAWKLGLQSPGFSNGQDNGVCSKSRSESRQARLQWLQDWAWAFVAAAPPRQGWRVQQAPEAWRRAENTKEGGRATGPPDGFQSEFLQNYPPFIFVCEGERAALPALMMSQD